MLSRLEPVGLVDNALLTTGRLQPKCCRGGAECVRASAASLTDSLTDPLLADL